ncbi:MAG: hypothetical protein AVDCRST_MAG35-310, partial [uncultured Quadrisphaera sp.]
ERRRLRPDRPGRGQRDRRRRLVLARGLRRAPGA